MSQDNSDIIKAVVISRDPLVVATKTYYRDSTLGDAMAIGECFEGRPGAIVVVPAWTWRKSDTGVVGRDRVETFRERFPNIRLIVFAADEGEREAITRTGAETVVINQNAFLDTDLFRLAEDRRKTWDAVYTAKMLPFKRHHLAAEIPRLAVVYYGSNPEYQAEVEAALPQADFPNGTLADFAAGQRRKWLNQDTMADIYARSHVGLCLSEREGTMWASAEYLLCGLPVVSVPSIGGRETFFDDYNCFRCEPTTESVLRAVERAIAARRDPREIRRTCLNRIDAVRQDFYAFMDELRAQYGNASYDYATEFMDRVFRDKLWKTQTTVEALRGDIESAGRHD